ncbi:hypothetical protein AVEN_207508-1, partial [Araneus ventricosus]
MRLHRFLPCLYAGELSAIESAVTVIISELLCDCVAKSGSAVTVNDDAPARESRSVWTVLDKHEFSIVKQPPYSPDLAPWDFFLLAMVKSALKGTGFEDINVLKIKRGGCDEGASKNVPARNSRFAKTVLDKHEFFIVEHQPYS